MNDNIFFFKFIPQSKIKYFTFRTLKSISGILRLFYVFMFIALPIFFSASNPTFVALTILLTPITYIAYASLIIKFEDGIRSVMNKIGTPIGYEKVKAIELFITLLNSSLVLYSCILNLRLIN